MASGRVTVQSTRMEIGCALPVMESTATAWGLSVNQYLPHTFRPLIHVT